MIKVLNITAAILLASSVASAETSVKDTLTIDESVVISTKTGVNISEIPAGVSIVTSLDSKRFPSPTVADIFRREPGRNVFIRANFTF